MTASISQRLTTILFVLGFVQASLIGSFAWFTNISFPLPRLLFIGAAVMVYMAVGILATRHTCGEEKNAIRLIWGIGLAMRVMVIPLTPELSDDVYRYLWDGHVQYSGVSPYLYAPADPALESIRTLWHEKINHPDIPTLYPPLAQLLFFTTWIIGGTIFVAKLLWVAFDILTGSVIVRIARSLERPVLPILVWYFWSPLLIVEVAWNGHFDIIGVFLAYLVALGCCRPKGDWAGWQVRSPSGGGDHDETGACVSVPSILATVREGLCRVFSCCLCSVVSSLRVSRHRTFDERIVDLPERLDRQSRGLSGHKGNLWGFDGR